MRYFATEHPKSGIDITVVVDEDGRVERVCDTDKTELTLSSAERQALQHEADAYFEEGSA